MIICGTGFFVENKNSNTVYKVRPHFQWSEHQRDNVKSQKMGP